MLAFVCALAIVAVLADPAPDASFGIAQNPPEAVTQVPNAWDPWGNPPPLSPFEASPYIPHPSVISNLPKPYYHPAMGPAYQAMQMLTTPGFNPFSPRQISLHYDPVTSPSSQGLYFPMINPYGILPMNADPRPWIGMMENNPAAFAQHLMPGVMHMQAMSNAIPTLRWMAPTPAHI